jgi:murein DD-endopeptidase / murein LD-carboxypeptidase
MIAADAGARLPQSGHGCRNRQPFSSFPLACLIATAAVLLTGCSTASPRYRASERQDRVQTTAPVSDGDESRFAAKIRQEEAGEDDRKVDLTSVRAQTVRDPDSADVRAVDPVGIDRDKVLLDVVGYLGTPYRHGGTTKDGLDCSGFTSQVYTESLQLHLPRSTREQFEAGTEVDKERLQFGDLVFFNTTGHSPSHVGIYIEEDLFAHASVTQGVTISSLESTYYRKRYVGAKRVVADPGRQPAEQGTPERK